MRVLLALLSLTAVVAVFRHVTQRMATHRRLLPRLRVNTRVHRINQHL